MCSFHIHSWIFCGQDCVWAFSTTKKTPQCCAGGFSQESYCLCFHFTIRKVSRFLSLSRMLSFYLPSHIKTEPNLLTISRGKNRNHPWQCFCCPHSRELNYKTFPYNFFYYTYQENKVTYRYDMKFSFAARKLLCLFSHVLMKVYEQYYLDLLFTINLSPPKSKEKKRKETGLYVRVKIQSQFVCQN